MSPATINTVFAIGATLYLFSGSLFYLELARGVDPQRGMHRWAPLMLGGGAFTHAIYVLIASVIAKVCPVHSIHFFLSIASLLATLVYLAARRRFRVRALGVIVAPVGLVLLMGTFFLGTAGPQPKLPGSFIAFHVLANLAGDALFLLAGGAAVMYLLQERRFKTKTITLRATLPPLDSLEKASHRFLLAGFPLLTLGVATGTVWAARLEQGSVDEVLRAVFGYATWLLAGGVLLVRALLGWRGRKAAYGTIAGFACALVVLLIYLLRPMLRGGASIG